MGPESKPPRARSASSTFPMSERSPRRVSRTGKRSRSRCPASPSISAWSSHSISTVFIAARRQQKAPGKPSPGASVDGTTQPLPHHDLSEEIGDCTIRLTELAPRDQLIHQTLQLALGDFLREVRVQHGDEALALARAPDLLYPLAQLPGFREQRRLVAACGRRALTARRRRSRRCARAECLGHGIGAARGEAPPYQVPDQGVEALVLRQDHAGGARRARQVLAEVEGDVEVERVLALALDVDRHEALAEPQRGLEELGGHALLRGAEEERHAHPGGDGAEVDLADVLVVHEQHAVRHGDILYCLLRSARAGEAILPPRLVHDQRDGVGKVQAPVPRAHRDGELPLARHLLDHLGGEAAGLRAEEQRVPWLEGRLAVGTAAAGLDAEEPCAPERLETGGEARVQTHLRELLVVEAGPAHRLSRELEAERFHEVERRAAVGGEADDVAGVGWD